MFLGPGFGLYFSAVVSVSIFLAASFPLFCVSAVGGFIRSKLTLVLLGLLLRYAVSLMGVIINNGFLNVMQGIYRLFPLFIPTIKQLLPEVRKCITKSALCV